MALLWGLSTACAPPPPGPRPCDEALDRPNDGVLPPSADLYCLPLMPTPGVEGSVTAELGRPAGPFTVAVGKIADLVLMEGDFVADPGAIRDVALVFKDGVGYRSQVSFEMVKGRVGIS